VADIARESVREARRKARENDALLVCGYEDAGKFRAMQLEGAFSLQGYRS
jgi:hypothetical protein